MSQLRGTNLVIDTIATKKPVISGLGATRTLNPNESGSLVVLDRVAGIVVTLPAPAVGATFDFIASESVTSNAFKIITNAGTVFLAGDLTSIDTDTSNAVASHTGNGSTHVAVSMNGTTTGGLKGTHIKATCVSSTLWVVEGSNQGSGVVATPFATS